MPYKRRQPSVFSIATHTIIGACFVGVSCAYLHVTRSRGGFVIAPALLLTILTGIVTELVRLVNELERRCGSLYVARHAFVLLIASCCGVALVANVVMW
jgi:hypothetical protein